MSGQVKIGAPAGRPRKPAVNGLASGPVDTLAGRRLISSPKPEFVPPNKRPSTSDFPPAKRPRASSKGDITSATNGPESISSSSGSIDGGTNSNQKVRSEVKEFRATSNPAPSRKRRRRTGAEQKLYAGVNPLPDLQSATEDDKGMDSQPSQVDDSYPQIPGSYPRSPSGDDDPPHDPPPANFTSDILSPTAPKKLDSSTTTSRRNGRRKCEHGEDAKMDELALDQEPARRMRKSVSIRVKRAVDGGTVYEPEGGYVLRRECQNWLPFASGGDLKGLKHFLGVNLTRVKSITFAEGSPYIIVSRPQGTDLGPQLTLELLEVAGVETFVQELSKIGKIHEMLQQRDKDQHEKIAKHLIQQAESRKAAGYSQRSSQKDAEEPNGQVSPASVASDRMPTSSTSNKPSTANRRVVDKLRDSAPREPTSDRFPDSSTSNKSSTANRRSVGQLRDNQLRDSDGEPDFSKPQPSVAKPVIQAGRRSTRSSANSQILSSTQRRRDKTPEPVRWTAVHEGWEKQFPRDVVYPPTGRDRATVVLDDIARLDEKELLNDNLVLFGLRYFQLQAEAKRQDLSKKVYLMNTYFFEALKKARDHDNSIRKWTSKVDLLSYDYIVVPVNEALHWYLAIICNPSRLMPGAKDEVEDDADTDTKGAKSPAPNVMESAEGKGEARFVVDDTQSPRQSVEADADTASKVRKGPKKRQGRPPRKHNSKEPLIITLDSLGHAHPATIKRLKRYLLQEIEHRTGGIPDPALGFTGVTAKNIPEQPNFSDCGLFLLGYFRAFMEDPDEALRALAGKERVEWPEEYSGLRNEMRDLLFDLSAKQHREYQEARKEKKVTRAAPKVSSTKSSTAGKTTSPSSPNPPTNISPAPVGASDGSVANSRPSEGRVKDAADEKPSEDNEQDLVESPGTLSHATSPVDVVRKPATLPEGDDNRELEVITAMDEASSAHAANAAVPEPTVPAAPVGLAEEFREDETAQAMTQRVSPELHFGGDATSSGGSFDLTAESPAQGRGGVAADPEDVMDLVPPGTSDFDDGGEQVRSNSAAASFDFDACRRAPPKIKESVEESVEERNRPASQAQSTSKPQSNLSPPFRGVRLLSSSDDGEDNERKATVSTISQHPIKDDATNQPRSSGMRKSPPSPRERSAMSEGRNEFPSTRAVDLNTPLAALDLSQGRVSPEPRKEQRGHTVAVDLTGDETPRDKPDFVALLPGTPPLDNKALAKAAKSPNKRPSAFQIEDSPNRSPKRRKATGVISHHFQQHLDNKGVVRKDATAALSRANGVDYLVTCPAGSPKGGESVQGGRQSATRSSPQLNGKGDSPAKDSGSAGSTFIDLTE